MMSNDSERMMLNRPAGKKSAPTLKMAEPGGVVKRKFPRTAERPRYPWFPALLKFLCSGVFFCTHVSAEDRLRLQRRTESTLHDVATNMMAARQYEDLIWLSDQTLRRNPVDSSEYCHALVDRSLAEVAMEIESSAEPISDLPTDPLTKWLSENLNHPFRFYVRSAVLDARRRSLTAATANLILARDESLRQQFRTELSTGLVRLSLQTAELRDAASEELAGSGSGEHQQDLKLLIGSLSAEIVLIELLQTRLYPSGSESAVSASASAAAAAKSALETLPAGSEAYVEVTLLMAAALRQAGRGDEASAVLSRQTLGTGELNSTDSAAGRTSLRASAILANVALDQQSLRKAEAILQSALQSDPPSTLELDLAWLRFLILDDHPTQQITQWIETIAERHGQTGRRIAESRVVETTGGQSDRLTKTGLAASGGLAAASASVPAQSGLLAGGDAALIAIEGREAIRRGEAARGGHLLAIASQREQSIQAAAKYAIQSAAATLQHSPEESIQTLLAVAGRFAPDPKMADLSFQAIHLAARHTPDQLGELLKDHLRLFPAGDHDLAVREWQSKLKEASGDFLAAAAVAPVQRATEAWLDLFEKSGSLHPGSVDRTELSRRFVVELADSRELPERYQAYRRMAVRFLDLEDLRELTDGNLDEDWLSEYWLYRYRTGDAASLTATDPSRALPNTADVPNQTPDSDWDDAAVWRMAEDGRQQPERRETIAQVLRSVPAELIGEPSIEAQLQLWDGQTDQGLQTLSRWIAASPTADRLWRAATVAAAGDSISKTQAIRYWDQLAAGTEPATERWYTAKWSAIELLASLDSSAAAIRAKYLILTTANLPTVWRERLESIARTRDSSD